MDHFFADKQNPILCGTFALQVGHYQYIKRTQPAFGSAVASIGSFGLPRPLRAGLGWMAVFAVLMTKVTLAKKTIRDYSDPIVAHRTHRKSLSRATHEGAI